MGTADVRLIDRRISTSFAALSPEFWDARARDVRDDLHALFQYPAMMVPSHQTEILRLLKALLPEVQTVLDPFVGAGTTMTACMQHGLSYCGQDINPLAVLLCHAKCHVHVGHDLARAYQKVLDRSLRDDRDRIEAVFPTLGKWFSDQAATELSRLRRAIRAEPELHIRRFLWAVLAETVRLTSNTRTSTYKLHIRPEAERSVLRLPHEVFRLVADQAISDATRFGQTLDAVGVLGDRGYAGEICLSLGDTMQAVPKPPPPATTYDIVLTSPPYGDNTSTIPYGQQAYLPLQWIDLQDIASEAQLSDTLRTTQETDRRSLGGQIASVSDETVEQLSALSPAFADTAAELRNQPRDRLGRVAAFCHDLGVALSVILPSVRINGYMVWFIGNRHVGGIEVPTTRIFSELAVSRGAVVVAEIERTLRFRRMATRNRIASMMRTEHILVLRRGCQDE